MIVEGLMPIDECGISLKGLKVSLEDLLFEEALLDFAFISTELNYNIGEIFSSQLLQSPAYAADITWCKINCLLKYQVKYSKDYAYRRIVLDFIR